MIVDSDVVIELLRGNPRTTAWFQKQRTARAILKYSPVTRAEVRAGTRPKERAAISALFESITVVPIEASTADLAGEQLARYARTHNVQLGDALIAAGALEHGDKLATFNARHFPGVKEIVKPDR